MSITVVGSVALDTVKTPFGHIEEGLGGSASHFSASASFFAPVNLVGVVGKDFPKQHVDFFKSRPIDIEGLEFAEGKTFRWVGRYDYDLHAQTLETHLNVFEAFRPKLPERYKKAPVLFVANIQPELQQEVIRQAGRPELIGMDTMNLWINLKKAAVIETMGLVDFVTVNESEARLLTETSNLRQAARKIRSWGPEIVVIKQGEYGALLFHKDEVFSAPALPLEDVLDPTGAGDSFAGGLTGYLAHTGRRDFDAWKTAVICGSVMASFNVEKFSCDRLKEITLADVRERFARFEKLAHFKPLELKL
jgi:sugar/nucleoside kinase (ribokinase family)